MRSLEIKYFVQISISDGYLTSNIMNNQANTEIFCTKLHNIITICAEDGCISPLICYFFYLYID